jgi:hypothetical protein
LVPAQEWCASRYRRGQHRARERTKGDFIDTAHLRVGGLKPRSDWPVNRVGLTAIPKPALTKVMVPNWKKDLDALVTETIAFATSVNERKLARSKQISPIVAGESASEGDAKDEPAQPDLPVLATIEAVLADGSKAHSPLPEAPSPLPEITTWPARLPPMTVPPSERDEIKQRLANFKAHQLKMQAEREDYYSRTMTRTRELAAGLTLDKNQ